MFFFPVSITTDAAVFTLLGYLDLGLSEVMQQFKMNICMLDPACMCRSMLPLLPPALAITLNNRLDGLDLFLLFTTAAFYAR